MQKKDNIIINTCCAIFSAYPVSYLIDAVYSVSFFFYNPNIYPDTEYQKRLEAEKTLCRHFGGELIEGDYDREKFLNCAKGLENEPEKGKRCIECFKLRLEQTAKLAKAKGIKNFTKSIVISPHMNFALLSSLGQKIVLKDDLNYIGIDFNKKYGFLKTNQIAKSLELYRQNYCGCEFALRQMPVKHAT